MQMSQSISQSKRLFIETFIHSESMKYVVWMTKLKTKWVNKRRCINRTIDFSYLSLKDIENLTLKPSVN